MAEQTNKQEVQTMINTVEVEGVKLFVSNKGQIYNENGKELK